MAFQAEERTRDRLSEGQPRASLKKSVVVAIALLLTLTACNRAQLDTLAEQQATLQDRLTELETQVGKVSDTLASQSGGVESLQAVLGDLAPQVDTLSETLVPQDDSPSLPETLAALEADLGQLDARITTLSREAAVREGTIPTDWPEAEALEFSDIVLSPPEPTRVELSNGIVLYLLEDHSLPLIDGVAYLDVGSLYEPEDKVGLADLTADVMRTGGAGGRSPDEIDEELEFLAASVEVSSSGLLTSVSFSSLVDNVEEVLEIFADVIMRPDFDEERLEVSRGQALEGVRRQNDQPMRIASREFFNRLAEGHPASFTPTEETLNAVTRRDLIDFHDRYFKPNITYMALSGDFETEVMVELLEDALGNWRAREVDLPELPPLNPNPEPNIYYVNKEVGQSIVLVGHPSVLAYTDAYNALDVANGILGGEGFSSRITTEIRTKRGLAYSTGSALTQGFEFPGYFYAFSVTRVERTGEVIERLLGEIRRLQEEGVSQEELDVQRNIILNRAVFRFSSPAAIARRAARIELLELAPDYYETYIEQVQSITPERVQEVASSELRPDEMIVLVVGDETQFDRPLSDFGEVVEIELE
jgi:predicted Zn-dependent peptidase/uncharacterized coiled-coil protein SlyX